MSHRVERSALVNYSPKQMFDLVNDIEAYPQYMNDCIGAEVLERGDNWLKARLELQKAGISQSFVTLNELHEPHSMSMSLVEGPFSRLDGVWRFEPVGDSGCRVSLELEFKMQNRLLSMAVGKFFESAASQQVDALCQRAQHIYGTEQ
ncbi:type II toxin-antitoxin system RatA family toxin [Marinimicrobium sp. ARAG 43.8]|uniref:type II toxin-antitoxin system RatA family toxin n=1 Tax=Marinimicrobium sp. ARAG 43.8 TaxID=3418719 RepID=UPI003CEC6EC0